MAGGKSDPIDTIAELSDAENVRPLVVKAAILFHEQIKTFQNDDVQKIVTKIHELDDVDYEAGFKVLSNLERFAWIEASLFLECGSAQFGESLIFSPPPNARNTFYEDYIALPFPKNSTLVRPFDKV